MKSPLASLQPRGLRRREAAVYVGVGETKFDEMVADGRMPKPITVNACKIWDRYQLDAAFDALSDAQEARWREPVA